ncbi:MAG TPA: nucleoside hydrolase [Kofleriaceae bacterium]
MKRIACLTIVVALVALTIIRSTPASARDDDREVPRFIIDTDMDNDDAAAIAYMCQEHLLGHVRLLGVTITNNGVGLPGKAIKHARCLLAQCGLPDLPVADANLPAPNVFPDDIRNGTDQTLENVFPGCQESEAPSAVSAPDLLRTLARSDGDGKVTLLATGPLSNIAQALHDSAGFRDHVAAAFVMGGAVHVGGNLCCGVSSTFDNSQEFNFWTDPAAVRDVFQQLRPGTVTLVPLDATNFVPLLESFDTLLQADPRTGAARFVAAMVADPGVADFVPDGFLFWWDPLAAVAATTSGIVRYESDRITVVQSGPQQGALVVDPAGAAVRVGIFADQQEFQRTFFDRLNAIPYHGH